MHFLGRHVVLPIFCPSSSEMKTVVLLQNCASCQQRPTQLRWISRWRWPRLRMLEVVWLREPPMSPFAWGLFHPLVASMKETVSIPSCSTLRELEELPCYSWHPARLMELHSSSHL